MAKRIDFNTDALVKGINTVADAVKTTMGARGRTVILERPYGGPSATKDGMTVAKNITLEDPQENMGAVMMQEVATRVADIAGDGTTCATVLTQKLINEGRKAIAAGMKPQELKTGIELAMNEVINNISANAKKIENNDEVKQVATISANGDEEMGNMIAEAVEKIGQDGVITVEEAKGKDTEIDVVQGFQFEQGFLSPYFCTDTEKMVCEFTNPRIMVSAKRITNLKALLPILEPIAQSREPLLIIADEIDSEATATLVLNRIKGGLKICAVKAPGFGDRRKEIMGDIAALTGATLITDDLGMSFDNITPDVLGTAKRVSVDHKSTLIIGGDTEQDAVDARINEIRNSLERAESDYEKEKLRERLGRLTGGVAVIRVGGMTEAEVKEKKDRVDDAVAAVRAALEEGVVPGGGVALLHASEHMPALSTKEDEQAGINIVCRAIREPIMQIMRNADLSGEVIISKIVEADNYVFGFDVKNEEYGSMFEMGIIDPAKVVKTALRCATSCAVTVLTSGCVVSEIPEEPKAQTPTPMVR